jgi:hypothetical protein
MQVCGSAFAHFLSYDSLFSAPLLIFVRFALFFYTNRGIPFVLSFLFVQTARFFEGAYTTAKA